MHSSFVITLSDVAQPSWGDDMINEAGLTFEDSEYSYLVMNFVSIDYVHDDVGRILTAVVAIELREE